MEIIGRTVKLCAACMEEHEVATVRVLEETVFKGQRVRFPAVYEYCDQTDSCLENEEMSRENDRAMKDAYRRETGLLTSGEIAAIREKYQISQRDLAVVLEWGEKTITRYEGHQIQEAAYDMILRKIDEDPKWYLSLLEQAKDRLSPAAYARSLEAGQRLFAQASDHYHRRAIEADYSQFEGKEALTGGQPLALDKVVDVIRFFSNAGNVTKLFKVKLMKLMWYSDFLSYKARGRSITGLVYQHLPMGAVPVSHETLIKLEGVRWQMVEFRDHIGYRFLRDGREEYPSLSPEELRILKRVGQSHGHDTREEIVRQMHQERGYEETLPYDFISYQHADTLELEL